MSRRVRYSETRAVEVPAPLRIRIRNITVTEDEIIFDISIPRGLKLSDRELLTIENLLYRLGAPVRAGRILYGVRISVPTDLVRRHKFSLDTLKVYVLELVRDVLERGVRSE